MKIYTRTGDKGETGYIGGRISKASLMISVLGELDELNAVLGVALSMLETSQYPVENVVTRVRQIQNFLFEVGAEVADKAQTRKQTVNFTELAAAQVVLLEQNIDELESTLPELKQFILPGGEPGSAFLHQARAVCRRVERAAVDLAASEEAGNYQRNLTAAYIYLNRLSDYLFVAGRTVNNISGKGDTLWKPVA